MGRSPEQMGQWDGLSVFATEDQARRQARALPRLGRFVAEIDIGDGSFRVERTNPGNPGHHTLWGNAERVVQRVVRVTPV